jgi:hypothetical protein
MHKQLNVSVHTHDHRDERVGLVTRQRLFWFLGHNDMLRGSAQVHKMAKRDS